LPFVERHIRQLTDVGTKKGRPLLDYTLLRHYTVAVNRKIVRLLVAVGADPNDVFCGKTVLARFEITVRKLARAWRSVPSGELASRRDLLEFLRKVSQARQARQGLVSLTRVVALVQAT
jgi:hypothetical protein